MSYFKAKIHQVRFTSHRTQLGSLQRCPKLPSDNEGYRNTNSLQQGIVAQTNAPACSTTVYLRLCFRNYRYRIFCVDESVYRVIAGPNPNYCQAPSPAITMDVMLRPALYYLICCGFVVKLPTLQQR